MSIDQSTVLLGVMSLVIVFLVALIINHNLSNSSKQGFGGNPIGLGIATEHKSVRDGFIPTYQAKTQGSKNKTGELVARWYEFNRQLGPDVSGVLYALFPSLQTAESVQNYGLSDAMVSTLRLISHKLVHPEHIHTLEQVNAIFSPIAIKIFNKPVVD